MTSHRSSAVNVTSWTGRSQPCSKVELFCLQDRRLPLTGQILEGVSVEQRLVEFAALNLAHVRPRRVGDNFRTQRLSAALAIGEA